MAEHNDFGKEGERMAVEYLEAQGYKIVITNWRYRKLELDIIAEYQGYTVIVEVKSRSSDVYGKPQDFVGKRKIKLLLQAVNSYANFQKDPINIRLDIVSIQKKNGFYTIDHLEDAFYYF